MSELKTYVLSRMMYDPTQDPVALIDGFLAAYFGAGAVHIRKYLDTMHASVTATGCEDPDTSRFIRNPHL